MKIELLPFVLMMLVLHLGGCAVEVKKSELIPSDIVKYKSTGKSIYVSPVNGRPQPKAGFLMQEPPRLDRETFHEVIVETLHQSGLFSEVKTNDNADLTLSADIIGQRQLGAYSNVELLLVRYKLKDPKTNREIWSENLFSHFEMTAAEVFMGHERTRLILEGVTRDNMSKLGKKLDNVLSSPSL